jgi:ribonuclease D
MTSRARERGYAAHESPADSQNVYVHLPSPIAKQQSSHVSLKNRIVCASLAMTEYKFVDSVDKLPDELASEDIIGIDTEFMREKTFFAQLCLVQMSAPDHIYFLDPLDGSDLEAFWEELMARTWVLHSGRQDIEVVAQTAGRMPTRIFDTQIAAGLLGMAPQLGYATLARDLFDVDLPKTHTRADWTRRPLPDGLLHYAAEDVEYLLPAYEFLCECLENKGRLAWAEEDSAALLDPALYSVDPSLAIGRLKGARNLRGTARAAAERLAAWRESEALRRDRPRQWIARDAVLLEIATKRPKNLDALAALDGMPPKLVQRAGGDLLEAIAASHGDSNDYRPPGAPDEQQKVLLREMQAVVAKASVELDIAAEVIAPKKELSAVISSGKPDSRVFSGWRKDVIGEQLLDLM